VAHPYPDEQTWWADYEHDVADTYISAGRQIHPDPDASKDDVAELMSRFRWWSRPGYSIGTGMVAHEARTRHLRELEVELGLPEMPVDGGLPVSGYPDENTWWNDQSVAIAARYAAAGRPFPNGFDFDMFKWSARPAFDIGAGLSPTTARSKHLRTLRQELSVPAPGGPVTTVTRPLIGPLRVQDRMFRDDFGWRRIFFCSWFAALRILRDDPAEFERQLNEIVAAGYQGVRIFLAVGGWTSFWDGREVAPVTFRKWFFDRSSGHLRPAAVGNTVDAWPDYDDILRTCLRMCRERGLRLHVTCGDMQIICPDAHEELALHRRFAQICADEGGTNVIACAECTNEFPLNRFGSDSPQSIAQMGRVLQVWRDVIPGVLTGQGAIPQNEEPESLAKASIHGDICFTHTTRDPFFMALKRSLGLVYWEGDWRGFPRPFWQGEPAGPGPESYQRLDDPASLVALYAMHALTGQASNWFSGAAVRSWQPLESEYLPEDVTTWDRETAGRGAILYWTRGKEFRTVAFDGWDSTPPRAVAEWKLLQGTGVQAGSGQPPNATGLLVGRFH
jgi:hypothetical protein